MLFIIPAGGFASFCFKFLLGCIFSGAFACSSVSSDCFAGPEILYITKLHGLGLQNCLNSQSCNADIYELHKHYTPFNTMEFYLSREGPVPSRSKLFYF